MPEPEANKANPKIQQAYDAAYEAEAIEQAKTRAKIQAQLDAQPKKQPTPFYKKLLNAGTALAKDLANSGEHISLPEVDPLTGFRLREPTPKRRRKR